MKGVSKGKSKAPKKKPQSRAAEAPRSDAVDPATTPHPDDPRRNLLGQLLPGNTANPGGIPKQALELRQLALKHADKALQRAIAWLDDADPYVQEMGVRHLLNRALGKDGTLRDLPTEAPPPADVDTSPSGLLSLATRALARVLQHMDAQAASGQPMTEAQVEQVAEASRTLVALEKERRELDKADPASKLPTEELRKQALAAMSEDELREELRRRLRSAP